MRKILSTLVGVMAFGTLAVPLLAISLTSEQSFAQGWNRGVFQHEGGRGGGGSFSSNTHRKPVNVPHFPKYPSAPRGGFSHAGVGPIHGNIGHPAVNIHNAPVFNRPVYHADSLGNRVTIDHMNRVGFASGRAETLMRNDTRITDTVRVSRAHFTNIYRPVFVNHEGVFNGYVNHYNSIVFGHPPYLDVWYHHGFYGGFYWGFHPILDIDNYFYNPMVYWLYNGTYDPYYYRTWYQDEYTAYPELARPFAYHGLYYPTENLKQLLFGVSAMTVEKQAHFRDGITTLTEKIAQHMANGLGVHVKLQNGDIAVTHYEVLGYDDAVDLEGVVSWNGQSYNFKGLVDLQNPGTSDAFVPATWDKNPNAEQLAKLDSLNAHMAEIKGVSPEDAQAEPVNPDPTAAPPAEVTADPKPE